MAKNSNLTAAKKAKNDEFYTQKADIEAELSHYAEHFKGKVVYCNCDDPVESEFWKFFVRVFKDWGLRKLIATHYEPNEQNYSYKIEAMPDENGEFKIDSKPVETPLPCNGDFRSAACIELLKEADIVVTNPPFSLFRDYVAQLMEYGKKFLIIGSMNAITYKEIFPLLKGNDIWLGYNHPKQFRQPDGAIKSFGNIMWYTNLEHQKRHQFLDLRGNKYYGNEGMYPRYDNYDAVECSKVGDIPEDYFECIGVPITFLDKYCPEQFELVGADFELAAPVQLENGKMGRDRFYITHSLTHSLTHSRAVILPTCHTAEEIITMLRDDYDYLDDEIEYCSGIMGVPITFLDKYCPEQFEIVGFTSGRDEFDKCAWPTKHYTNPVQVNSNGSKCNGSKANTRATILLQTRPEGVYYTASESKGYLSIVYGRILIRKKGVT